jgi:prepilin-type N-terminal cleavage/methylation domain-containing protein
MMGRMRKSWSGGFTLVEVMLVVLIIGILAALAGSAWQRYVKRARTTEAFGHLQKMWAGSIAYYEADHADSAGVMKSKQFAGVGGNCATYAPKEPTCCNSLGGRCLPSDPVYRTEPWVSIGFTIPDQHLYTPTFTGCATGIVLEVWGDLDCDNTLAKFIRRADVNANGDVSGYLTPAVINETE